MQKIPIRRSGNRENLFLDCDRELIMMSGLCSFALIFSAQDIFATFFGIGLWLFSLFVLRLIAKSDPKMRQIYLRHRKYKKYYPARSTPFRKNRRSYS
ncbi:conjugal transfer protein TrbD [Gilliamella sp. HK2]|jgi:type IV secretion system protein TrbD|uniref:conjugal transfer protein TrbD n=1 Tax=unclassified Gilliamella TaxID=2685620 RepID=UPI00080E01B6|nr:conjugal transfer protein TrbD [Gilliamella apicola]OCG28972.1 conjugal transfer protein TrbD [Gilliamella apicola]OCG31430.1 conjugal transfer protein TrbD [Gilliamella apicola]